METRRKMKLSTSDKVLLGFGYAVLGIFVLAILIPLVYVVVASFMDPNVLNSQGISFALFRKIPYEFNDCCLILACKVLLVYK